MRINFTLGDTLAEQIATALKVERVAPELAEVHIIFNQNFDGGVSEMPFLPDPEKAIVIAGTYGKESCEFAAKAQAVGIPDKNIYFTNDDGISLTELEDVIKTIPLKSQQGASLKPSQDFRPRETKSAIVNIPRLIGVVSRKGGVGRTTFATSLAAHYLNTSEKAVVVDECTVPNVHYHLANAEIDSLPISDDLKSQYRRIIVDVPIEETDYSKYDFVVAIVNSDMLQCVEPLAILLPPNSIAVYNQAKTEIPAELLQAVLNIPVITVAEDVTGCMAALCAGVPAINKSDVIADAIGKIAAAIDKN